jgi:hypothetical protein
VSDQPLTRLDRWSGPLFVVIAFVSSAGVSLPLSSDPPDRISALYAAHRVPYVAAQVVGLVGVVQQLFFVRGLHRFPETRGPLVTATGLFVALAALGTNVAVLILCFGGGLSPAGVHRAAVATDVTDDVLFLAFGMFAAALALTALPTWLRVSAAVAALLCLAKALEPWWRVSVLHTLAPLVVLLVLFIVGLRLLRSPRTPPAPRPPPPRGDRAPDPAPPPIAKGR